jgi:NADPH:quinone reductase-like Zn-dependent oxidoreductase
MKNHRVVVTRRGGPDVLRLIEEDLPEPGRGEARIKVEAAGVSAYDLTTRSHWYPGTPSPPFTPGEDFLGVIDGLGEGVTDLERGRRVAGWTFGDGGGYAEFICRPGDRLVPVPSGLPSDEAVCLVINYLTASLYLHRTAAVQSGERILVHGAAGGVGTALLQLGRIEGLEMYGTASPHNHELVSSLGATPIDYQSRGLRRAHPRPHRRRGGCRLRPHRGRAPAVAFVPVPAQGWSTHDDGQHRRVEIGLRRHPAQPPRGGAGKVIPDGRRAPLSPNMTDYPFKHPDWYRRTLTELLDLGTAGTIEPVIAERVPLAEATRAHEILERSGHAGKVVLVPDA